MIVKFAYNNYCSERAGVAEWQTHLTQNQAGNTVWVQVPPPAPLIGHRLTEVMFYEDC